MQSHQSAFGGQQTIGHKRRPSLGKSMPVTSLLLNLSSPSSKNYSSLSKDGMSPEFERPPLFFNIHESNDSSGGSSIDEYMEKDFEILEAPRNEDQISLKGDSKVKAPCSSCKNSSSDNSPLTELCKKLCTKECCCEVPSQTQIPPNELPNEDIHHHQPLVGPPSRIDMQRKQFLTNMLGLSDDDNSQQQQNDSVDVPELIEIVSDIIDNTASTSAVAVTDDTDDVAVVSQQHPSSFQATPQESGWLKDFREKFAIAEALAKTSAMTSPAVKRRLAARRVEMELDSEQNQRRLAASDTTGSHAPNESKIEIGSEYEPPRDLLMYLVRMGSFNSAPKINNIDSQDDSLEVPQGLSTSELLQHIKHLRGDTTHQLLTRYFVKQSITSPLVSKDITDGLSFLQLNSISKVCSAPITAPNHIRLLQWNILSQTLGQNNDGFVRCPDEALTWDHRKFLIVQEILQNNPDIVCLQEVDHFKFLENILGTQNYAGIFFPKPDSPCLYIEENNGPDGCAVFYKRDKFELKNFATHILEVWRVQSNQVAIAVALEVKATGKEICVCTTHLKARHGSLLSKLRNEQGKDLIRFVKNFAGERPIVICGDFNAEPIEPVYATVLSSEGLNLSSAYADIKKELDKLESGVMSSESEESEDVVDNYAESLANCEPPYTTWKIREEGEVCHTIDYVFYSKDQLKVKNCLEFPQGDEIGKNRTPSYEYPSDHFSLVCDFELLDNSNEK